MLNVKNLSYKKKGNLILDSIALDLKPGKLTIIVGPNGAGKSSLLRHLSGELTLQSGTIRMGEQELSEFSPYELAIRRAVLPQNCVVSLPFLVEEVVEMGAYFLDKSSKKSLVLKMLSNCGIEHLSGRYYINLSGGEQQRVQLARCLLQLEVSELADSEKVLLLDEPTAGLDLEHQFHIVKHAKAMTESGLTVVAILHDLQMSRLYADFVIVLEQGRLVKHGLPEDTLTPNLIQSVFKVEARIIENNQGSPLLEFGTISSSKF